MSEVIITEAINHTTNYSAVLCDYGHSTWLMLHDPSGKVVGDVWVYNSVPPITKEQINSFRPNPPPATSDYCSSENSQNYSDRNSWQLVWGSDNTSVCATYNHKAVALIESGSKMGQSKNLIQSGPWGSVLNDNSLSNFNV